MRCRRMRYGGASDRRRSGVHEQQRRERSLYRRVLRRARLGRARRARRLWRAVDAILRTGPLVELGASAAHRACARICAVREDDRDHRPVAAAADEGYRIVVALLGSTNLCSQQNQDRLARRRWGRRPRGLSLGPHGQPRRAWPRRRRCGTGSTAIASSSSGPQARRPHRRSRQAVLEVVGLDDLPVLIVDDEADQASLNTQVNAGAREPHL